MATVVTGRVVLVFALAREAVPLKSSGLSGEVVGMGSLAAVGTRRVVETIPRPDIVISVGIVGGLRDGFNVGDVIVPSEVVSNSGRRWSCVPLGEQSARLLTVDRPLLGSDDKRRAGVEFTADVVDMEAAHVAEVCAAASVPFAAVKAVCDPVDVSLPAQVSKIAPDGNPRFGQLILAVARRPRLIAELVRLDRASRRASWAACERVRDLLIVSGPSPS